ncbi:MAG: S49 family peptidase, partial [Planctomycetes bacterium]|nr:S49 family peptidase [Planctomycetota bacterium]
MRSSTQIFVAGMLLVSACLACDQLIAPRALAADTAADEKVAAPAEDAAEDSGEQAATETKPKKVRLAHIAIKGQLPESPGQMTLFGDLGTDLRKTIARLDKAAQDDRIAGVILEIRPAALARGKLNELSAAILRVRGSGKKVYAHLESAMGAQYLLATACDEIVMPESGVILIPGIHAEFGYYKGLLENIGIEADMLHVGDAKGAAEPLTRRNMSESVKKNMTALVDDLFDQMITKIAP